MGKYLVFGHQNPDTDAIAAAIAMSYYLGKMGEEAEPVALGTPNDETRFALDTFAIAAPRVIQSVADEVAAVALVDHNEPQQSVVDLGQVEVHYVVDHHRIKGFETAQPLYYRCEPIGCTSTVLYKMFVEQDFDIPQAIAGLMVSAIISDTLLFKSPTSTHQDHDAAMELAKIAGIDLETYGMALLKAGTNLADKTATELLNADAKNFEMGGKTLHIGQINTVDLNDVLSRKDALIATMKAEAAEHGYDVYLAVVTDILNSTSVGFVVGNYQDRVEAAFGESIHDYQIALPGVVSRKKQVVPPLTEAFEG